MSETPRRGVQVDLNTSFIFHIAEIFNNCVGVLVTRQSDFENTPEQVRVRLCVE